MSNSKKQNQELKALISQARRKQETRNKIVDSKTRGAKR
jgi:hypothetical protein